MKKNTFLSAVMTLIFSIACSLQINAQSTKSVQEVYRPMTKTERSAGIQYSEDQKNALGIYYTKYLADMKAVRENKEMTGKEKEAAYIKVKTEYRNAIKSNLTPSQFEQYSAVEQIRKQAMEERQTAIKANNLQKEN
jgi:hypothetical protein